jgi:hypothetical protein
VRKLFAITLCLIFYSAQAELITEVSFTERTGTVRADEIIEVWVTLTVDSESDPLYIDHLSPAPQFGLNAEVVPAVGQVIAPEYDPAYVPFVDWEWVHGVVYWSPCGENGFNAACGRGNYGSAGPDYRKEDKFEWYTKLNEYTGYPNKTFLLNPGESMNFLARAYEPADGGAEAGIYEVYNVGLSLLFGGGDSMTAYYNGRYELGSPCKTRASTCAFTRTVVAIPTAEINVQLYDANNEVDPASNNLISIGIHSTSVAGGDSVDFDATQVDPSTLKLGVGEATNVSYPWVNDWDGDTNFDDVAFGFRTPETGIICGDTEVLLNGETYAGDPFTASDSVSTTDCADTGCHP